MVCMLVCACTCVCVSVHSCAFACACVLQCACMCLCVCLLVHEPAHMCICVCQLGWAVGVPRSDKHLTPPVSVSPASQHCHVSDLPTIASFPCTQSPSG